MYYLSLCLSFQINKKTTQYIQNRYLKSLNNRQYRTRVPGKCKMSERWPIPSPNSAGSFYPIAQNRVTQIESSVSFEKIETGIWERWLEFSPRVPEKNNLYREVHKPAEGCL